MNEQEIYQKIGELLWSIMAEDAKIIFCTGMIYPDTKSYSFEWTNKDNNFIWFDIDGIPHEIGEKILSLMEILRSLDMFTEKWTHFKISLTEEGKINFEFAYIPEEDHWPGLYMRRVGDLTLEELDEHNIPLEEWKKRVKLRNQSK